MQTRKIAGAFALIAVLCSGSFVLGQNTQPDTQTFEKEIQEAQREFFYGEGTRTLKGAERTVDAYDKAVGNSAYTKAITKQAISLYYSDGDKKVNIQLQALQVAQNQKIIELLEKLAAEKK